RFSGFRIGSRTRPWILRAEQNMLAAGYSQQQLDGLTRMQAGIEVQHAQSAIELVHGAAALEHVIRLPAADLIGNRSAAVRHDDLQLGEILQYARVDDRKN